MMDTVNADLQNRRFAGLADLRVDLFLCLLDHLLNAGGMDASVHDQFFQTDSGDLPAYGIEGGKNDCFGRVVDDQINARRRFERADIPALASDDPSLHLIVGQWDNGHRRLGYLIRRTSLDRQRDDISGSLVRFFLCFLFDIPEKDRSVMTRFLFNVAQKDRFRLF